MNTPLKITIGSHLLDLKTIEELPLPILKDLLIIAKNEVFEKNLMNFSLAFLDKQLPISRRLSTQFELLKAIYQLKQMLANEDAAKFTAKILEKSDSTQFEDKSIEELQDLLKQK